MKTLLTVILLMTSLYAAGRASAAEFKITIQSGDDLKALRDDGFIRGYNSIRGYRDTFIPLNDKVDAQFKKVKVGDTICAVGGSNPMGGYAVYVRKVVACE